MDIAVLLDAAENMRISTGAAQVTVFSPPTKHRPPQLLARSGNLIGTYSEQVENFFLECASRVFKQGKPTYKGRLHDDFNLPSTNADTIEVNTGPGVPARMRALAAVPLNSNSKVIGILLLSYSQAQRFQSAQRLIIEALAQQVAISLQHINDFEILNRRHVQELEDLQAVDRDIMRSLELDTVLETILNSAARHVHAIDGMIALLNPTTEMLEARAVIGRNIESRRVWRASPSGRSGVTQRAFSTKRPVLVPDLRYSPDWSTIYDPTNPTISELAVPLIDQGKPIGVIDFESAQPGAFDPADQDFLVTLAGQAVLAIRNAEAYERERRIAGERQILIDIGKEVTGQLESSHTFALILQKAVGITNATAGTLHLLDARRKDLWVVAEEGGRDPNQRSRQALSEGIVGYAATTGHLVNVDDVTQSPWDKIYIPFIPGIHSELAVPVHAAQGVRGVINVESRERSRFTRRDEQMLTALADLASIAIENAERFRQIQDAKIQLESLHNVDQRIIQQLDDPQGVIRTVLESAVRLVNADAGVLYLCSGDRITRSYALRVDKRRKFSFIPSDANEVQPNTTGLLEHIVRTRFGYYTHGDAQVDACYTNNGSNGSKVHSAAAVPLLISNDLVGVLQVESSTLYAFDDEYLGLLDLLAGQAVIAIQNANSYAIAARESRRFHRLYRAAQRLGAVIDLDQLDQAYDIVFEMAAEPHNSRQVAIRRLDPDRRELVVVRSVANNPISTPDIGLDEGINGWVIHNLRSVVVPDMESPPAYLADVPNRLVPDEWSLVVVPIAFGSSVYGTLTLSHEERNHFWGFEEADLQLFEELAHQLAVTIHRLEATQARREAERRAIDAETVGEVGQLTLDLAHRLKDNLGLVNAHVSNARSALYGVELDIERANQALDKILRDVHAALELGSRLLNSTASVFDQKQGALQKAKLRVEELITGVRQSYPDVPPNIRVTSVCAPDADMIYVYPHHVEVILNDLFVNAIQAMPEGGEINLRARGDGSFVLIQVQDTGPGIPTSRLNTIFNPFVSSKGKGSWGVGLWSALLHARRNGGDLTVISTEGTGTTFTLRLPKGGPDL